MPTPHTTQLIPCCCSQGAKPPVFLLTLCQRGLKGRSLESHTRAVSHRRRSEKGNGDNNTERNSNSSPQPANLPPPSPREGQQDAPDSAQAAAFVSTQGKVRGSSGRPGRPPQGPAAGAAGTGRGLRGQHRGTAGQRLSRLGGKAAHEHKPAVPEPCSPPRTPHGAHRAHTRPPVCPERSAPCPVMGESRTGLWHSLPKALQESHLDSA